MAEEAPYRVSNPDPIDLNFYDNSVDPGVFTEWKGSAQAVRSNFYLAQYIQNSVVNPISQSFRATQPNPDTIFFDWKGYSQSVEALYDGVQMESAPEIAHSNYFTVIAALYSKATKIDPGEPCEPCSTTVTGGTSTGCKPEAELEMVAAPISIIEVDASPISDLDQAEIPSATLICKILS